LPIDKDEEEGLRAFEVRVGAKAGEAFPERPAWVERAGIRIDVESVESQWREEERLGFRVRLTDGACLLLYYVPELDIWSGVPFVREDEAGVSPRRRA
jgi:hypothetical protein